jgi:hypothetical protein
MDYRNKGAMPFDVEVLFRQILNLDQIKYISGLIITLGKYMVLDRSMLDLRAGKTGLSYIQRAAETKLIAEYTDMYDETSGGKKYYFYSLAPGGIYFLESEGFAHHKLPKYTNQQHRQRILTFNKWAIANNYGINMQLPQSHKFDYFVTDKKVEGAMVVGYFSDLTNEDKINDELKKLIFDAKQQGKDIDFTLKYEAITIPMIKIGNKSSAY